MLAGAALMLGAAIASAQPPRARGGHAVTIVPRAAKAKHGSLAGRTKPKPAAPITTAPALPIAAAPAEPVAPGPVDHGSRRRRDAQLHRRPDGQHRRPRRQRVAACHNGGCDFELARSTRPTATAWARTMGFGPVADLHAPGRRVYQIVLTESEYCAGRVAVPACARCPGVADWPDRTATLSRRRGDAGRLSAAPYPATLMDGHALDVLELAAIRERLANHTSFSASRALAEELLPSPDAGEVGARQALCAEALGLVELGPPRMSGAHDVRVDAEHAGRGGSLGAEALVAIAETARAALGVRGHLAERSETAPLLAARAAEIAETLAIVADRLERALELDPPGVKDSASPKLKSLRSELATARRRASDRLRSLASDPDLQPHLQEDFVTERGGRPVVAVRASARSAVPGIVHDTSNSGQTLFVEPFAIVELSNRLRELEGDERDEVARILAELSRHVGGYADELAHAVEVLAAIDFALACGALSRGWRGCPIEPSDDVELVAARHPLLDPATVVPIDLPLARRARARAQRRQHRRQDGRAQDARAAARCCTSAACTCRPSARACPSSPTCSPTSATSSRSRPRSRRSRGTCATSCTCSRRRRRARSCCSTRSPPAPTRSRARRSRARCSTSSRSARR